MAGDMNRAAQLLREALARDDPTAGVVQFIDARGPADLLTLKAARALAAADVLACDPGASAEVLALARRDAERVSEPSPERLAELAARGLRVARLVTGPEWRRETVALAELGADVEVLPIAG
jgi:precorrin-2 dehydrogenase/sirohydrochlorin ferrochelatase